MVVVLGDWYLLFFFFFLFCWWFLPWWGVCDGGVCGGCCPGVCGGGGLVVVATLLGMCGGCDWFAWEIETDRRDKDRERKERNGRDIIFFIYLYGLYYFNELDVKIDTGMLEEL